MHTRNQGTVQMYNMGMWEAGDGKGECREERETEETIPLLSNIEFNLWQAATLELNEWATLKF